MLIAAAVVALWPREKEPQYQGKTLSQWLNMYEARGFARGGTPREKDQAADAIRHIGTNALPLLVTWLSTETPPWRHKALSYIPGRAPVFRALYRPCVKWLLSEDIRASETLIAFDILREDASPAIPQLLGLMNNTNARMSSFRAVQVLVKIGPNGLAALCSVVTNQTADLTVRSSATYFLGYAGTNAVGEIQILRDLLDNPKTPVNMRYASLMALEIIGQTAREATPSLLRALDDPDQRVRVLATNALQKVAPDEAPN